MPTTKKAPATPAGATPTATGYVLQLVSVDTDQGVAGQYLRAGEEDYTHDIADAEIYPTLGAATGWIARNTDHGIHEVWAVVDRATGTTAWTEAEWAETADAESSPTADPDAPADYEIVEEPAAPAADSVVQGELLPPDAGAAPAVAVDVTGLEIDGAGEARLVAVALRAHAEDLAKLAKNAKQLGRLAEATTMERDARLITEELLAQLEPQTQLPFGYVDVRAALTARIHGKLRARLANQIRQDTPVVAGEQTQDREERILAKIDDFEAILGNVAEIVVALVEPVVVEAAERGVTAGRLARETTAPALALEAAEAVERAA